MSTITSSFRVAIILSFIVIFVFSWAPKVESSPSPRRRGGGGGSSYGGGRSSYSSGSYSRGWGSKSSSSSGSYGSKVSGGYKSKGSKKSFIDICFKLGKIYVKQRKYEEAMRILRQMVETAQQS